MADQQYDVSPHQRRILEDKARRRTALRAEFLKQASDPHMHATGEGGGVFDTALQRFIAMKATGYDNFKPSPRTSKLGFLLVGLPILGYGLLMKHFREKDEHLYRTGQVAYQDRHFKLI